MRLIVFFDLPVKTKEQKRVYNRFRRFLLNDGYHMVQYSVYARVCNGIDSINMHKKRISDNKPDNGSVRVLVVTEKQYQSIEIIIGKRTDEFDEPAASVVVL